MSHEARPNRPLQPTRLTNEAVFSASLPGRPGMKAVCPNRRTAELGAVQEWQRCRVENPLIYGYIATSSHVPYHH